MAERTAIDQDYSLWGLLFQTRDALLDAREKELHQYGLTAMQVGALSVIKAIGNEATPAQIARWLLRRPHTVSGILARMEKAGLIKKTKNLNRKNLVRVTITDKGQQAYNQSMKRKSIHKVMAALPEEDRKKLNQYLEILRTKGLKEAGLDPKKLPLPKFP